MGSVLVFVCVKLITRVSVKCDELFHELCTNFHEPEASKNTDYE